VERYEKRTPGKKNKVTPQQQWMDLIQQSVNTAPGHLKHHLEVMAGLDNVPRKEKQFRNFATNSLNLPRNSESILTDIWNHLKQGREQQQAERAEAEAKEKEASERKKKAEEEESKKTELLSKETEPTKNDSKAAKSTTADLKSVKKAMKKVLKKAKDKSLPIKNLRKAVQERMGMPKSAKSELEELVQMNVKSSKKQIFLVNGKTITLKAS
jgi:hypothetical protein